ncbi:MAG: lipopolysaccharide assembly protein LapA domain-containing protein [Deltaproteobacteria bacterium]|jgi:uncharacterized integral membrane protein|uniref:DUF1049 domain-containing protein n=1 Tax=Candidatus Acidulodesulfobacterium acidiphilum TaxID=2597224 RepID=A0A520XCK2_9DELT|nr:lipopolysaccharide assembly protein LapA domain-containing protein [Deltaproteobacteria bacterium]RZV38842.1 MAG: DUF1049 domain-containing protein [Candidatus Acidulodesulfobacterium acidiphilum]
MAKIINIVLLLVFVILVLDFTIQNHIRVSVKLFGFQSIKLPISVIVYIAILIGILIALIYHFYSVYKIKKDFKKMNKNEQL